MKLFLRLQKNILKNTGQLLKLQEKKISKTAIDPNTMLQAIKTSNL